MHKKKVGGMHSDPSRSRNLDAYPQGSYWTRKCRIVTPHDGFLQISHISNSENPKGPFQITSSQREDSRFGWGPGWRLHTAAGGANNPGSYWIPCSAGGKVNGVAPESPIQREIVRLNSERITYPVRGSVNAAPDERRGDKGVVLATVAQDGNLLQGASVEWKGDREVVLAAVAQNGLALRYASNELKADREVVLVAVAQNAYALGVASEELRGNREVVLAAVNNNGNALMYASEELKGDKEVVLAAVAKFGNALKYSQYEPQAMQYIRNFLFTPPSLLDSDISKVIKSNMVHNIDTLKHIPPEDPTYKDYVRYALQTDPRPLAYIHGVAMEDPGVSWYAIPKEVREQLTVVPPREAMPQRGKQSPEIRMFLEKWLQLGIKSPDILRFFPYQYREDPLLMKVYQETHRRFFAGAYVKQSQPDVKGKPFFRMGIELECCGTSINTAFSTKDENDHCVDVFDPVVFEHISHLFEMVRDETVDCPRGQCRGEIIVRSEKTLMFNGNMYQVSPDGGDFLDNLKHIGNTFHPSYGYNLGEGGRFQVHISAPELPYGNPDGLQFAKTLLCLWAMARTDGTYQDRFTLMGHSDESWAWHPPYNVISQEEMRAQFQHITPDNAPEQSEEDNPYESFRQFIVSKLKWLTSSKYAGMFFYSLFEHIKYAERPDDLMRPVRLEFRGFHNVLRIAHSLAQLELSAPHILAGQSPGNIFKTYVHQHMKDVHFFFDLAYKTSGSNPLYADAMKMVRGGDSLDAIIGKVAALEEEPQLRTE
jgi:hypothetical protein